MLETKLWRTSMVKNRRVKERDKASQSTRRVKTQRSWMRKLQDKIVCDGARHFLKQDLDQEENI